MIYTFSIQRLPYYAKVSMVKLANLYWYNERHDIECRRTITSFGRVPPRSERTHGRRSEERRVGKVCDGTCRSRCAPDIENIKNTVTAHVPLNKHTKHKL